ncbi:MFS transporter [Zwartia sp.]|uniref:MFS transporter n=1 Tax=Zwartia sp. TaxID=2978004 RepID=UPI002722B15B|nr:MFS transporter [Zwartia sp.]MDO9025784.1 MFS transporter [Zwartia sp.]
MNTASLAADTKDHSLAVRLLLNVGHGLDHMFLLIFAASVGVIAADFGFDSWEDLMPYGVGAFVLFGLGSIPSGRLGDLWGRRRMMVVFFIGIGASTLLAALTQNAWQLALALTLVGAFASIYHPVGIPFLVQKSLNPGYAIGINGLAGNLGVALAAVLSGFLIKWFGWRAAFAIPALLSIACGIWFAYVCPAEPEVPAKRKAKVAVNFPPAMVARALAVMTVTAATGSVLFNFTTNGNGQLLLERFKGIVEDPATLGIMLAAIYTVASLMQVVVGKLLDRFAVRPLFLGIVLMQIPLFLLASYAQGWWLFAALLGVMVVIFGAIPFVDVMVVRYVDDRMRSRVAGIRLAISLGLSSLAVWALGPSVKSLGFEVMLMVMAGFAVCTALVVTLLPKEPASSTTTSG